MARPFLPLPGAVDPVCHSNTSVQSMGCSAYQLNDEMLCLECITKRSEDIHTKKELNDLTEDQLVEEHEIERVGGYWFCDRCKNQL
jgi:hypothetical protein